MRSTLSYDVNWTTYINNWAHEYILEPSNGVLRAGQSLPIKVSVLSSNIGPLGTSAFASEIRIGFDYLKNLVVNSRITTRASATLTANPSSFTMGKTSDGMVFERPITIRNTGYSTPGGGIYIGNMFHVVQDPGSDPALTNNWGMGLLLDSVSLGMTNGESRTGKIMASFRMVPAGQYRATLYADDTNQVASPLVIPLLLNVGEDFITIDSISPMPGTQLIEGSYVNFEAKVHCQVQGEDEANVNLVIYDSGGIGAIGSSEKIWISRNTGETNLTLSIPSLRVWRDTKIIAKADLRIPHGAPIGYEWKYSTAYEYPVVTNAPLDLIALGQKLRLPGGFNPVSTNHVKVQMTRSDEGIPVTVEAPIEEITATSVTVRVPVDLLGRSDRIPPAATFSSNVTVRVITGLPTNPVTNILGLRLLRPRLLVHDEVFVPPALPAGAALAVPTTPRTLLQFLLNNPANTNDPATVATFMFLGQSTDGHTGLRTLNTALGSVASGPLRMDGQVRVFQPALTGGNFEAVLPFHLPNQGSGDEGLQFDVLRNGAHVIVVGADPLRRARSRRRFKCIWRATSACRGNS